MQIQPGQTYRSADPRDSIRIRIKTYTPGENRALVVDASTGKRPRPMLVAALHTSPTTQAGKPRRSGYVLEQPKTAAARQTTGQDDTGPASTSFEPQDHPGADLYVRLRKAGEDHDTAQALIYAHARMAVRQHTAIHGDGPAVGQPAEAHDTDRAELRERLRLAIAQQYLDDTGSGRTVDELDDTEFGSLADAALKALTMEDER
jgi:hypothetical protein